MIFQKLPPPTKFSTSDKYRLFLGIVALILGIVILWRTIPLGISPPGIMLGAAFIGFGLYRLWLAYTRLKQLKGRG